MTYMQVKDIKPGDIFFNAQYGHWVAVMTQPQRYTVFSSHGQEWFGIVIRTGNKIDEDVQRFTDAWVRQAVVSGWVHIPVNRSDSNETWDTSRRKISLN